MAKFEDKAKPSEVTSSSMTSNAAKMGKARARLKRGFSRSGAMASAKTLHVQLKSSIWQKRYSGRQERGKPAGPDIIEVKLPGRRQGGFVLRRDHRSGHYVLLSTEEELRSQRRFNLMRISTERFSRQKSETAALDAEGSIYLSSSDAATAIQLIIGVNGLLDEMGYGPLVPRAVERGSWFTNFTSKARAGISSDDAKILAEQARITAEAYAEKQKVENLEAMARATASLMGSVPEGDTAVFDLPGLRMVSQEVDGKRHWVVQGETSRTQAIRTVDQAKAMSEKVFEGHYPSPEQVETDQPPGELEG